MEAWRKLRADVEEAQRKDPHKPFLIPGPFRHWPQDTDFAGVLGENAPAQLPEVERKEWRKLWQEVKNLRSALNDLRGRPALSTDPW
jgi:hypothetical protein